MLTYLIITFTIILLFSINSLFLIPNEIKKFNLLIGEKKFEEAMKVYKQSLETRKDYPEIIYGLAQIYEHRQEWYLAVYEYQNLIKAGKFPQDNSEIDIRLKRINANKMVKDYEEVASDCYAILKIDSSHYIANYEIGKRLYTLKNYRAARPFIERINKNDNKEILEILLNIEINEKKFKKALNYTTLLKEICNDQSINKILFKEIIIYYNLKNYSVITEIQETLSLSLIEDERPPLEVAVVIGISLVRQNLHDKAIKYFDMYLKNYIDDSSDYILEGRYLYADLLTENKNFIQAQAQNQYIQQVNPDYQDVGIRDNILKKINNSHEAKRLFSIDDIKEFANEIVKFKFSKLTLIENKVIFNKDETSDKKWLIFIISTTLGKVYYLFICLNLKPFNKNDTNNLISIIEEKINSNLKILNFIFLSLYGMSIESEKTLIQTFNRCFFHYQEDFINYFEKKKLPIFPEQ